MIASDSRESVQSNSNGTPSSNQRRPEGQPPIFEKIGIVGLGLIGGSIALAARELWPSSLVIAVDNKDVLETAMRLHAIDVAADDLIVLAEADLVVLAAPARQNIALLEALDDNVRAARRRDRHQQHEARDRRGGAQRCRLALRSSAAIRSAARRKAAWSTRGPICSAGVRGSSRRPATAAGPALEKLMAFVRALGAEPRIIGVDAHDRLLAFLSHLPQLTASALMQVVGDAVGHEGLALSGRGLADTTRLASSPADIWKDIAATNADEIGPALDALIAASRTSAAIFQPAIS